MKPDRITAVPTNIITGFLGAGKTSAILQLLKQKPASERWAILVNEFGEIGVDGELINGQQATQQGVFIREVPGGCMCCAAGVPMQIALNQLLKASKPDRLLIEPTGLGHPKEVLSVLSNVHYQEVLSLQQTITLVDARQLNDPRYTSHETFNQQIAIADSIIGNKVDLYRSDEKVRLANYVEKHGKNTASVSFTQQGEITLASLTGEISPSDDTVKVKNIDKDHSHTRIQNHAPIQNHARSHDNHQHQAQHEAHYEVHHQVTEQAEAIIAADDPMPACGFIKAINQGEGFVSSGWRFSSSKIFDYKKLHALLTTTKAERIKAVFITDQGSFGVNITADSKAFTPLANEEKDLTESRIEVIALKHEMHDEAFETKLFGCLYQVH